MRVKGFLRYYIFVLLLAAAASCLLAWFAFREHQALSLASAAFIGYIVALIVFSTLCLNGKLLRRTVLKPARIEEYRGQKRVNTLNTEQIVDMGTARCFGKGCLYFSSSVLTENDKKYIRLKYIRSERLMLVPQNEQTKAFAAMLHQQTNAVNESRGCAFAYQTSRFAKRFIIGLCAAITAGLALLIALLLSGSENSFALLIILLIECDILYDAAKHGADITIEAASVAVKRVLLPPKTIPLDALTHLTVVKNDAGKRIYICLSAQKLNPDFFSPGFNPRRFSAITADAAYYSRKSIIALPYSEALRDLLRDRCPVHAGISTLI